MCEDCATHHPHNPQQTSLIRPQAHALLSLLSNQFLEDGHKQLSDHALSDFTNQQVSVVEMDQYLTQEQSKLDFVYDSLLEEIYA